MQRIEFDDEAEYVSLFLLLPKLIYHGDSSYRKERRSEVTQWLSGKDPCTGFLLRKNMIVVDNDRPVARGIVFANLRGGFGSIGFFECTNSKPALMSLLEGAKNFCRRYGMKTIFAPMNGSIWSGYRLMTKGFADKPFLGEPYNKPYYYDLLKECGFTLAKTWETQYINPRRRGADNSPNQQKSVWARWKKLANRPTDLTLRIRSLDNFKQDIKIIHELAMNSFADFFLFHEIDAETFTELYGGLELIANKRTVKIASNANDETIGFAIALPDYQSMIGFFLRYAKRYVFLYLGVLQKDGVSTSARAASALITETLRPLYTGHKGFFCAMMGADAKTRTFTSEYDTVHEYALLKLETEAGC